MTQDAMPVEFTKALPGLIGSLGAHVAAQHERARALREQIEACQGTEELMALRWQDITTQELAP